MNDKKHPEESLSNMERAVFFEKQAYDLKVQNQIDKAFEVFDKAASLYRAEGEHLKAALCYAAAAGCWNIHTGWQPLQNAASRSELAAEEALKAGNYDYACSMFHNAAMLYEKEGDYDHFTNCYIGSRQASRKHSLELAMGSADDLRLGGESLGWRARARHLFRAALNFADDFVWGYGEKPFRTVAIIIALVLLFSLIYVFSGNIYSIHGGSVKTISLGEALYFSGITFTTVGYGDYLPMGWVRAFAVVEALCGLSFVPLFLIGLSRRYLRTRR